MEFKIGIDWKFWAVAIGVGKVHHGNDCECEGVAIQVGPVYIELYRERVKQF